MCVYGGGGRRAAAAVRPHRNRPSAPSFYYLWMRALVLVCACGAFALHRHDRREGRGEGKKRQLCRCLPTHTCTQPPLSRLGDQEATRLATLQGDAKTDILTRTRSEKRGWSQTTHASKQGEKGRFGVGVESGEQHQHTRRRG